MTDKAGRCGVRRPSPHGAAVVTVVLAAAFAFGAADQYLGTMSSSPVAEVSSMSAPWLLVPFLAGAWQPGQRRAALVGLAATWLAVLGYVVMIVSPMEGTHLGLRPAALAGHHSTWIQLSPHVFLTSLASQGLWFAGGLVTGPIYGWLGYRWRARQSLTAGLLAALPVLLEPAARWLASRFGQAYVTTLAYQWRGFGPAAIAEVGAGLVLTGVIVTAMARRTASALESAPSR